MTVLPGQRLSLQSHTGRGELWIVIDDGAVVQVGEEERAYLAGDEIWIPANAKHRLSCRGDKPVRVLEVAFGNWQQDDYHPLLRRLPKKRLSPPLNSLSGKDSKIICFTSLQKAL